MRQTIETLVSELEPGMVVEFSPDPKLRMKDAAVAVVINRPWPPESILGNPSNNAPLPPPCTDSVMSAWLVGEPTSVHSAFTRAFPAGTKLPVVKHTKRILTPEVLEEIPLNAMHLTLATTAGADPEIFAVDEKGNVIPAWEYLPSRKNAPKFHNFNNIEIGSVYYDGFQAEFTTRPVTCHGHFTDYIRLGMQRVWEKAKKKYPHAQLSLASALPVSREVLFATDPDHVALGCAPSENVYGEGRLAVPDPAELEWRFAGCHLHYGSPHLFPEVVEGSIRMLDNVAGVMNVAMAGGLGSGVRRQYYGRAGEYRYHKPGAQAKGRYEIGYDHLKSSYRLEYRVPDTTILAHPASFNFFIDIARIVMKMGAAGLEFLWNGDSDETRAAINNNDVVLARKILGRNEKLFRKIIARAYGSELSTPVTNIGVQLVMEGVESIIPKPTDLVGNWKLDRQEGHTTDCWMVEGYRPACYRHFAVETV